MIQKLISILKKTSRHLKNSNKPTSKFDDLKSISREENTDMNNVVHSIFFADSLYNQLKTHCHPDRFVHDKELEAIATDIFQKLSESRRNLKMLKQIKEEAINNLKIKI